MKGEKRVKNLGDIKTFEDVISAIEWAGFPQHLFKMMEAGGEKNPYTFYNVMIWRGKVAFVLFNLVYLGAMIYAAKLIFDHNSFGAVLWGVGILAFVMAMVVSDMMPHLPTTRKQAEEKVEPFVRYVKKLYHLPDSVKRKLDFDLLIDQITLAKMMKLIPFNADMDEFIKGVKATL